MLAQPKDKAECAPHEGPGTEEPVCSGTLVVTCDQSAAKEGLDHSLSL